MMNAVLPKPKRTILALDDDEANLIILEKAIERAGYESKCFMSSEEALHYLSENPRSVQIAVIDKMMPKISGIEFLNKVKQNNALKHIPVIIQTGDVGLKQMQEGLEHGAYYYLTKPFTPETLMAILKSAENECSLFEEVVSRSAAEQKKLVKLIHEGEFHIHTFAEARVLAAFIAQSSRTPSYVARGLMELLFNAIEHGNLEIGYQKKHECLVNNTYNQEIAIRLSQEKYQNRSVKVHVQNQLLEMHVTIVNAGNGFNWRQYMIPDMNLRLNMPNGRGMAIAAKLLGGLHYNEKGTEVTCKIDN
ncbi:MAG TPA: response regulator [Rickettsiales bacterium]|nr:response regulator [Rickettsiales bacterium]